MRSALLGVAGSVAAWPQVLEPHAQNVARHSLLLELEPVLGDTHRNRVDIGNAGAASRVAGADRDRVTDPQLHRKHHRSADHQRT